MTKPPLNFDAPDSNTPGAIIFLSYIIVSLILTALIARSLIDTFLTLPQTSRSSPSLSRDLNLFTALAILSFSVLSYHMLDVLITSYEAWAPKHQLPIPTRIHGVGGILGSKGERTPLELWAWMRTSALFRDFAMAISRSYERAVWSSLELFATLSWNTIFVLDGSWRRIDYLWAYVLLSQILPTSFAQNLFRIACLMRNRVKPGQRVWRPDLLWLQVPIFIHAIAVLTSTLFVNSNYLFYTVAAVRLLTLWPFLAINFLPRSSGREVTVLELRDVKQSVLKMTAVVALSVVALQIGMAEANNGATAGRIFGAVNDDPAVSALGYDWVISVVSATLWTSLVDDSPVLAKAGQQKVSA